MQKKYAHLFLVGVLMVNVSHPMQSTRSGRDQTSSAEKKQPRRRASSCDTARTLKPKVIEKIEHTETKSFYTSNKRSPEKTLLEKMIVPTICLGCAWFGSKNRDNKFALMSATFLSGSVIGGSVIKSFFPPDRLGKTITFNVNYHKEVQSSLSGDDMHEGYFPSTRSSHSPVNLKRNDGAADHEHELDHGMVIVSPDGHD